RVGSWASPGIRCLIARVPPADLPEDRHSKECDDSEAGNACLSAWYHDERCEQRPDCGAKVAANLEQGLRQPIAPAGSKPRDTRCFGMEDRRSDANERSTDQ